MKTKVWKRILPLFLSIVMLFSVFATAIPTVSAKEIAAPSTGGTDDEAPYYRIVFEDGILCRLVEKQFERCGVDQRRNLFVIHSVQKLIDRNERKKLLDGNEVLEHCKVKMLLKNFDGEKFLELAQIGGRDVVGNERFEVVERNEIAFLFAIVVMAI